MTNFVPDAEAEQAHARSSIERDDERAEQRARLDAADAAEQARAADDRRRDR